MGCGSICFCKEEEEEQFFDTREDISSASNSCPGSPVHNLCTDENYSNWAPYNQQLEVWVGKPESIEERRSRFRRWMGMTSPCSSPQIVPDCSMEFRKDDELAADTDRITYDSGAVLRSSDSGNAHSFSGWSSKCSHSSEIGRTRDFDGCSVSHVDELQSRRHCESNSDHMGSPVKSRKTPESSPLVHHFTRREDSMSTTSTSSEDTPRRRRKTGWLKRLGVAACVVSRNKDGTVMPSDTDYNVVKEARRVKVHSYRKRTKEFSAVYMGHDIKAHEGPIRTMKFSPDGQYLASGGEDGIVRVWQVRQCERTVQGGLLEEDPSCLYFAANHNFELDPICMNKEKNGKSKDKRKGSNSACVVIPPEVFQILEKPLHEFHGHSGDVLNLSWSKNKYLLSSSVDKTVRLWQVGCDNCIKVFPHNDYVTCVEFNPIEEQYFISGSIDGKVRIWDISGCNVVDWTDIREIVTAVCYRPDEKEVVVGSMSGNCRFYCISDNHLQLDTQIFLSGKKKFPCKRITGFQFSPVDPQTLLVTSADSQIRILDRFDIICKYKGIRNAGSLISASFSSDGKHIISASEDSSVYVWNHISEDSLTSKRVKKTWSSECFFSSDVSVAIPWNGIDFRNHSPITAEAFTSQQEVFRNCPSSSGSFSLNQSFFSEVLPKSSATWPEEKLPSSSLAVLPALCKSPYKFLKTSCQNAFTSPHAWGQVIVTAGLDGRIRSFSNYGLPVLI